MITVLLVVSAIMLLMGVPIGIGLAIGILVALLVDPVTTPVFFAQVMYSGFGEYALTALPCFILAGSVMETGGLSRRLVDVAQKMVGNTVGGLGSVTVLACMFFGAISGSSPATVAAIGIIMIPEMIKRGYGKHYATGLVAAAGGLGIVVPPSIPLILYGIVNNVSIGNLFLGGFGPALVIGALLVLVNMYLSKKKGYVGTNEPFNIATLAKAAWEAKWALAMPLIILGGIYGGVFTPTEAAVVAVVYGVIVGRWVYGELTWPSIWKALINNVSLTGGIMMTLAPSMVLGTVFSFTGVPEAIQETMQQISNNKYVILALIDFILLIMGMFLTTSPAMIIVSPILLQVVTPYGVDPIHFGLVMTIGLELGFVTPPVALNLFVASGMTGLSVDSITRAAIPFILCTLLGLIIVTFCPEVTLYLLRLLGAM
ncbi:MAG: TRAP transporter large permease [Sporomusaceae bacterium]|nr:TRAP transporter large permease [Sporomusaceae bacterium]